MKRNFYVTLFPLSPSREKSDIEISIYKVFLENSLNHFYFSLSLHSQPPSMNMYLKNSKDVRQHFNGGRGTGLDGG